jgi:hypothetical protein
MFQRLVASRFAVTFLVSTRQSYIAKLVSRRTMRSLVPKYSASVGTDGQNTPLRDERYREKLSGWGLVGSNQL